ncbi:hypothetical protein GCM10009716_42320 [Streptomyces sodiiphilus]|uniref:3-oxoacyl-ACP synthase n=1 Tax=Streptomyces sodiiphilus TaxID=226217 RepID=A0ABP5B5U8_9ACTN
MSVYADPARARADGTDRAVFPLGLSVLIHRRFPQGTHRIDDAFSLNHFADLTALHGSTHRPELARTGNTFARMARDLLADLPTAQPQLAVVAHTTPDLDCRLAAVTALAELIPRQPQVFAISDCGTAALFTALRIAADYTRRYDYRSVAVFVLDQATLPYETGSPLSGDAGSALLFTDHNAADRVRLYRLPAVARPRVPTAVRCLLDEAGCGQGADGGRPLPLITGPGIDPGAHLPGYTGRIMRAVPGYPAGGTLAALAAAAELRGGDGRVAVLDREPVTGDLGLCLIERSDR